MKLDRVEVPFQHCTVSFRIPSDWVEGDEEGVGAVYGQPDIDDGALRLDVISVSTNEPAQARLLQLMAKDDQSLDLLTNGNVLRYYVEHSKTDETILLHYWHVGCALREDFICIAIFSFTLFKSRAQAPESLETVEFLDDEIRNAAIGPSILQ